MPGLRRDVLRWLVALNLSFPIKNIKRDFSNGFMVAEIFSRYFPREIQMHSYDYGSRAASKRDNWEQLSKFFRKKDFIFVKDEIDMIINCTTEEGAGPLLQRMYNFLTQKRCKPEDAADQSCMSNQASSQEWNRDRLRHSSPQSNPDGQFSSRSSATFLVENEYEESGSRVREDGTSCETMCNGGITLNSQYDFHSPPTLDGVEHSMDFTDSLESGESFPPDQGIQQEGCENLSPRRKKPINAVEKARQREEKRTRGSEKPGLIGRELEMVYSGHKSSTEPGLAFRSPNRMRNFKEYTLPDYRRQKQFGYVQLGSLGPSNLQSPELVIKRDKLERVKEFGRHARSCNSMSHANPAVAPLNIRHS